VEEGTACIPNIGPRQRRRRVRFGVRLFSAGVVLFAALWFADVERVWRLATLLPFWLGALGVFQARAKT
jgi:hypothetical protein